MATLQALLLVTALAGAGETVLLDFTSSHCGPCQTMAPTVQRLQEAGFPVRQVDISEQPQLASQYRIQRVPTFVLVVNGQEVERLEGIAAYDRLVRMFETAGLGAAQDLVLRGQSPDRPRPFAKLMDRFSDRRTPPSLTPPQPQPGVPDPTAGGSFTPESNEPPAASHADTPAMTPVSSMPAATPSTTPAAGGSGVDHESAQQRAFAATVRLKVEDTSGHSWGTGTIIHSHNGEALVVTCGHLFRDSQGKGRITAELFGAGGPTATQGQVLSYEYDKYDLALITIKLNGPVMPVPIAPPGYTVRPGDPVFSIGCDHGAPPTIRTSQVTAVNRYLGAPNLCSSGQPVDGRSGGGLFTADGLLIGVCNAADPQSNEGLYAALPVIQQELDRCKLEFVYQNQAAPRGQEAVAATSRGMERVPPANSPPMRSVPVTPIAAGRTEIICIVRTADNPNGEVVVVDQPSTELLTRLQQESSVRRTSASQTARIGQPDAQVVRGQSLE